MKEKIIGEIRKYRDEIMQISRELYEHPELSEEEVFAEKLLTDHLAAMVSVWNMVSVKSQLHLGLPLREKSRDLNWPFYASMMLWKA